MGEILDRVCNAFREQGISMQAASLRLGKRARYIENMKKNDTDPRASDVALAAQLLNIDVRELLYGEKQKYVPTSRELEEIVNEHLAIPLINDGDDNGSTVTLQALLENVDIASVGAVEIVSDDMIDAGLHIGDHVFYSSDHANGNGLYVVQINDKVVPRVLEFMSDSTVVAKCANQLYGTERFSVRDNKVVTRGKIIAVFNRLRRK